MFGCTRPCGCSHTRLMNTHRHMYTHAPTHQCGHWQVHRHWLTRSRESLFTHTIRHLESCTHAHSLINTRVWTKTHAHRHKKQTHTFLRGNLFVHAPFYAWPTSDCTYENHKVANKGTPTHAGFDYTLHTHKKPSTLSFVVWTRRYPPRWTC